MNRSSDNSEEYFQLGTTHNEHYFFLGEEFGLPLVINCGYNDLHEASRLTWHAHKGFEFVLVLEGSASYEFDDQKFLEISGGEYFVSAPGQRHRGGLDVSTPSKMCWIVFDPSGDGACSNSTFRSGDLALISRLCRKYARTVLPLAPSLRQLLLLFRSAVLKYPSTDISELQIARMRSLLCQLIIDASEALEQQPVRKPFEVVDAIKRQMDAQYATDLNIEYLASAHGVSRRSFHATFKAATGQTPLDYLQRLRVKHAQALLANSRTSVTQIALTTGFNSSQYFCKVFRKYTGCTPVSYRTGRRSTSAPAS